MPGRNMFSETDIFRALYTLNVNKVRSLLDAGCPCLTIDERGCSFLHMVVDISKNDLGSPHVARAKEEVIYMLIDAGVDTELKDNEGNTCLYYAVRNNDIRTADLLLQIGADMHALCSTGNSICTEVFSIDLFEDEIGDCHFTQMQETFKQYYPGLYRAVEVKDIGEVRRLTNLWCRTSLSKDGKSLKQAALQGGHEEIISLIFGIHDTMKLIYHVLARNSRAVEKILQNRRQNIQLDLRKMSERGAPILYYLIQSKEANIISQFVKHGCHVYTIMRDDDNIDLPVLFTAFVDDMPAAVIEALLPANKPQQEEMLYKLLYRGRTVLESALRCKVNLRVFDILVDRGGPLLVMDRNQSNDTVRDIAVDLGRSDYAAIIDKNVRAWITEPEKYPGRRQALALYGWNQTNDFSMTNKISHSRNNGLSEFLRRLDDYQNQIRDLVHATECGNLEEFIRLKEFPDADPFFEKLLCWDGRLKEDGLPILHRAVLFNHPPVVKAILDCKPDCQSIDTLFDQYRRTALHYAYACPSNSEVKKMLLDYGCSEHVLDRDSREPLDFKDKQGTTYMRLLLERIKFKKYDIPEPDPWTDFPVNFTKKKRQFAFPVYAFNSQDYVLAERGENYLPAIQEDYDMMNDTYVEDDTESEGEEQNHSWRCNIL